MNTAIILLVSILFQLSAAIQSLLLIKQTGKRFAWGVLAVATLLMAGRRMITLVRLMSGNVAYLPDPAAEWVALFISAMLMFGLAAIRPMFKEMWDTRERLRRYKAKLEQALTAARMCFWEWDIRKNTVYCSETMMSKLGFSKDFGNEYKDYFNLIHEEDRAYVLEQIQKSFQEGKEFSFDFRIKLPTGEILDIHQHADIILGEDGTPVRLQGIGMDITDRKMVERELLKSQMRLKGIMDIAPNAIITIGSDQRIILFNKGAERIFGYRAQEAIGQPLDLLIPDQYLKAHRHHIAAFTTSKVVSRRIGERDEIVGKRKNGEVFPAEASISKVRVQNELLFTVVLHDISDRKRIEEMLRESEARYRRFFEEDLTGDFIARADGTIIACNKVCANLLGYETPAELINTKLADIIPEKEIRREIWTKLLQHQKLKMLELELLRKDGKQIHVVTNLIGTFDHNNRLTELQGYFFDTSEQKSLERQLIQSQKMETIGTLAGGIAHDFNNIITPIIGYTDLALMDVLPESPVNIYLSHVLTAANRAKDLIQQILAFSRQDKQERKPVQLHIIVKEAVKLLRASLPSMIKMTCHIERSQRPVFANPTQVHQVVMNLCTNAYHAMIEEGGLLEVELKEVTVPSPRGKQVRGLKDGVYQSLIVRDNGSGMDEETLHHIFDPFFTTKEQGKGTGLGLSVVHGIVSSHDGGIQVESKPGKGTVFRVYFPLMDKLVTDETSEEEVVPTGTESIMIVDDEEEIVTVEKELLKRMGYQVTTFTSSSDALQTFRRKPENFDLLITDHSMPGLTGFKLAQKILKIHPDFPVILMTGFSETLNPEKARAAGISKMVMKPLNARELGKVIRQVLDEPVLAL